MSPTIHDVARRAGVSISTVSRVLNDTSSVREDKRRLVLEAAETLGYAPNPAALSLHNKRTGGVGVLLPFVNGEFFSEVLGGLDGAAQDLDHFLVVSTSHRRPDEFRKAVRALDKRVDGLVVMAPELDPDGAASILDLGPPVVFLNTDTEGLAADTLNFDNYVGARALTRHLLDAGHRHVAHVHGPPLAWDARERARGYREAMDEAGLDAEGLVFEGGYTREAGYVAVGAALAARPRPTAIVAANDYCALGALSALHAAGVAVPGEVAVGGFDGMPSARYAVPPLTTVRVPVRDLADRAVRRLVARLGRQRGGGPPLQEVAPVELVARTSTGDG
jgi:LacI family transcriptional regulator